MEYTQLSDALLVKLVSKSDEGAFREIYRRYWKSLLTTAIRKLGSRESAEELVQDIFIDIWSRREQVQIEDIRKYLFKAVKYKVLNCIKSQLVREQHECSVDTSYQPDPYQRTDNDLAYHDLYNAIEVGLVQLPEKSRIIFKLNRLENRSVREVALLLNIPERTVEYHITQSLRSLRQHLREFVALEILFFTLL
jgi:RNA polymerase sigma-70 factor (ECF subfamily)